ncbi:hypothetical protein VSS37_18525 [Candidatus Thiothrix sp. Deng01]|uniref:Uncharacterized protein n=1 Tax=Candidatus Thiothrix phosphatis TaxID=3112415 RepID=A0ABU6D2E7_9GAMM|nr:hypothetical protein [Candidatus Thiothrix sp. Deng01]MEB4592982.1 hypothetical protein [Candidatus Thiothrix sp. Deng01]
MHYLPHIPPGQHDEESLGAALWLERRYWERMEIAIANGISRSLGGDA